MAPSVSISGDNFANLFRLGKLSIEIPIGRIGFLKVSSGLKTGLSDLFHLTLEIPNVLLKITNSPGANLDA